MSGSKTEQHDQQEYPIPADWLLGALTDVAALPSQFATDRQRTLLDSAHLFTQHADHLPALATAVDALHTTHWPALALAAQSALSSLNDSSPPNHHLDPGLDLHLHQASNQLALIHSLQDNHADLHLLLTIPTLLSHAVHQIHPSPSTTTNPDHLGTLVDQVFSLAASLAALDRRVARRTSISTSASISSPAASPHTSAANLAAAHQDPTSTLALVAARAHAIVHEDLPLALLAHLTLPTSPLPTLLRAVAHLRRIDPSPAASQHWAHKFLASRLARLPPPPSPSPATSSLPTDVALAWIDAVRGHMFDTWAHARVVFPDVHVHPVALYSARTLQKGLANVMAHLASAQELALVSRHAHSAWGTACRRLGWDLGVPVVRPVVDAELLRRFDEAVARAVEAAVAGLGVAGDVGTADAADPDRPETWAAASRALAAFAAHVVDAVNAATFPRIPVAKLADMARVLSEAMGKVGERVARARGSDDKVWRACIAPHLCRSWDKVVEAAGIRGAGEHRCRVTVAAGASEGSSVVV